MQVTIEKREKIVEASNDDAFSNFFHVTCLVKYNVKTREDFSQKNAVSK